MPRHPKVPKRWIRTRADERAIEEGCWFDEAAGQRVCDFIENFCRQSQDKWGGLKIELIPWQRDFLMRLFSWKQADGQRRFRSAYLLIPKKNGKSTLLSALAIYLLVADGANAPLIYLNAVNKKQARVIFNEAKNMVDASPDLQEILAVKDTADDSRIVYEQAYGRIEANSKIVEAKDGFSPSAVIFDEVHRFADRRMWDIYKYAGSSRQNFLRIALTTAGESEDGVWHEQRTLSEDIAEGRNLNTRHLGVVFRADPEANIDDPEVWRQANPSMGLTIDEKVFADDLQEAKDNPVELANFMRLRLNIVVRGDQKLFKAGKWEACKKPHSIPLIGQKFWIGVDLSKVNDLTAMASIWRGPNNSLNALLKFWLPEKNIVELEREHGQTYRLWAERGLITLTPGSAVDYRWIRKDINEQAKVGKLQKILIDPWQAQEMSGQLQDEDGLPVVSIRQGYSIYPATKALLRLVLTGELHHDDNPILNWHAGNAVAVKDANGNIKVDKEKSKDKVDGLAALINAIAGITSATAAKPSVYVDRGLIVI